jgi:hypothetical protein
MSELEKAIRELLKGIDKDECEDNSGWWETSHGAKFGEQKLEQLIELVKKYVPENK